MATTQAKDTIETRRKFSLGTEECPIEVRWPETIRRADGAVDLVIGEKDEPTNESLAKMDVVFGQHRWADIQSAAAFAKWARSHKDGVEQLHRLADKAYVARAALRGTRVGSGIPATTVEALPV